MKESVILVQRGSCRVSVCKLILHNERIDINLEAGITVKAKVIKKIRDYSSAKQHRRVGVTCVRETWVQVSGFSETQAYFPSSNEHHRTQAFCLSIYTSAPSCLSRLLHHWPGWFEIFAAWSLRGPSLSALSLSPPDLCVMPKTPRVAREQDLFAYRMIEVLRGADSLHLENVEGGFLASVQSN